MTSAETGLPVRPLAGSIAVATTDSTPLPDGTMPTDGAPPAAPPPDKKPETIEGLIDRIFGSGT